MGHPDIRNSTPFAFEPIFIADEELRPVVVTLVKGTFQFDLNGSIQLADKQTPVNLAGEFSTDAPASSYRYEPEVALCKLSTDVVLIGHAQPPNTKATQVDVGIRVGPVQKLARVFGERFWLQTKDGVVMSRPAPLHPVALTWENSFGGRERTELTAGREAFEPRNPVGTGFGKSLREDGDRLRLPNIEEPNDPIREYGTRVTPCGFGFVSPNWQPRASFAGTYDEAWSTSRKPRLPADFDRRFFNAAPSGLVAHGYLQGDEGVVLLNTTAVPRLTFHLPNIQPPVCRVALRGQDSVELPTNLDTVILNTDSYQLFLLWRAYTFAAGGPHDVVAIEVTTH